MDAKISATLGRIFLIIIVISTCLLSCTAAEVPSLETDLKEDVADVEEYYIVPEGQIVKNDRRKEGSRLLSYEDSERDSTRLLEESDILYSREEVEDGNPDLQENDNGDRGRSMDDFFTNFENAETDQENIEKNGALRPSNEFHELPRTLGDASGLLNRKQSALMDHFIDKFITNYDSQPLESGISDKQADGPNLTKTVDIGSSRAECGGDIVLENGTPVFITSPNYPDIYPNDARCDWTVSTKSGTALDMVEIIPLHFELERGFCNTDYLSIIDPVYNVTTKTFCGDKMDSNIISMSNSLKISFVTDGSVAKSGFKLELKVVNTTFGSLFEVDGTESFIFSTPSFPATYPPGSKGHWIISSERTMSLELFSYYGSTAVQTLVKIATQPLETLQPFDTQKAYVSKTFSITFTDDALRIMGEFEPGIQFQALPATTTNKCGGDIEMQANSSLIINSSKYPNGYDDDSECLWKLSHNLGESYMYKLRFIEFDIETHTECEFDYFSIIDEEKDFNRAYCGKKRQLSYKTKSQELKLLFKSDAYNVLRYTGFSVYVKVVKVREQPCVTTKRGRDIWVVKSPDLPFVFPSYTVCDIELKIRRAVRFKIVFKKFNLKRKLFCKNGDHLAVTDKAINSTEEYCGDMEGKSIITAGNDIKLSFNSVLDDYAQKFEIEIKAQIRKRCGSNAILDPGTQLDLEVPSDNRAGSECIWVVQGRNSTLVLDFKRTSNILVSETALSQDLNNYNGRTYEFIDPSSKFMIVSSEARATIHVNAYATYSQCNTEFEIGRRPVVITNRGEVPCPITVNRPQNKRERLAIKYTLLSLPQVTCPLKFLDTEEGMSKKLCSADWRETHITSSTQFTITANLAQTDTVNNYMVLLDPVKFSCGETYTVQNEKIIVRSKTLDRKTTCVYRFKSDGNRMTLDIVTSSKRSLNFISVSVDGSFQTLEDLSVEDRTSLVSRKEFLVVVQPFPKSINFILHVRKEMPRTDLCSTCVIVKPGSQGTIVSPRSKGQNTYPAGLDCDVKFEGTVRNRTVILEFQKLDIPMNTSLDTLMIIQNTNEDIIEPSRVPPLPFTYLINTPFSIRFKTSSDNEYNGYKIGYNVMECGDVVVINDKSSSVIIESPGYRERDLYPTYVECVWQIEVNITGISDRIRLEVIDLKIHPSDSLEVIDPYFDSDPIASLTGSGSGSVIVSYGNKLRVVFKSDERKVRKGFRFKVTPIVSGCGRDINTAVERNGSISTMNFFPNTDYCVFRLRPSEGKVLLLEPKLENGMKNVLQFPSRRRGPTTKLLINDGLQCPGGMVVMAVEYLSQGERYCPGETMPVVTTTKDLLLMIKLTDFSPMEFSFTNSGCGGEITNDVIAGTISSPNYPQYFNGPVFCSWNSRSAMLVEIKHLDILPGADVLNLTDATHNITLTGTRHTFHALLSENSTITFTGLSESVKTGFYLEYEFVNHQGVKHVDVGSPAFIVNWPGSQTKPSAWQIIGPKNGTGLTIMVWLAYIPSDPNCLVHFLRVGGVDSEGERVCGGTGPRTIEIQGREAILVLHSTSPLASLAVSAHAKVI